jgi:hypothetical protein
MTGSGGTRVREPVTIAAVTAPFGRDLDCGI